MQENFGVIRIHGEMSSGKGANEQERSRLGVLGVIVAVMADDGLADEH